MSNATQIVPRAYPMLCHRIQNWSPVHDFVTTSKNQDYEHSFESQRNSFSKQKVDKIYACSGRDSNGSVIEFRRGYEAQIGCDIPFESEIMDIWTFAPESDSFENHNGPLFLLSLPYCSEVLQLSKDQSEIQSLEANETRFDLRYRTIIAGTYGDLKVQVTEKSVISTSGTIFQRHEGEALFGVYEGGTPVHHGGEIINAAIHESIVVFTTEVDSETYLQTLSLQVSGTRVQNLGKQPNHTTAIAICLLRGLLCAVVVGWTGEDIQLTFQPVNGLSPTIIAIPKADTRIDAMFSIVLMNTNPGVLTVVGGTRNGVLVILEIDENNLEISGCSYEQIGATRVVIKRDEHVDEHLIFATCDSAAYIIIFTSSSEKSMGHRSIDQIFLTDVQRPEAQSPKVDALTRVFPKSLGGFDDMILVAAGSRLLLAGLSTQARPTPRRIPIGGTPSRILYSHTLKLLLVASTAHGVSTLLFIDPETGANVSKPCDKKKIPVDYINGLGKTNDRIFRLLEWSYIKDGKTWHFIVLSTSSGRVVMISTEREEMQAELSEEGNPHEKPNFQMRFWTRYKFKCEKTVYSIVGYSDGLFYCSGTTLYCDTLILAEKRFKHLATYELPSPAINLVYEDGKLYALTNSHSLEILELVPEPGGDFKLVRTHGDQVTRASFFHRILGSPSNCPLHLISDKECSVAGLWATQDTRADTLDTVFEAQLPYSILRIRRGNCRPIWDPSMSSGTTKSPLLELNSADYPEILGMSIDGSLCNFTILDTEAWSFLRFLMNLALQSPKICEFTHTERDLMKIEPVMEPKTMMHVDGDILRRCLEGRSLEELLQVDRVTDEAAAIHRVLYELLAAMHRGFGAVLFKGAPATVLARRAYEDLAFFLRPVL
jgi:hypothetical protein